MVIRAIYNVCFVDCNYVLWLPLSLSEFHGSTLGVKSDSRGEETSFALSAAAGVKTNKHSSDIGNLRLFSIPLYTVIQVL